VVVVEYPSTEAVLEILSEHPGALAGSVFGAVDDPDLIEVVQKLAGFVGRVVVNSWPPGVLPSRAQHHGGPWPATSDPQATSVGGRAPLRFLRPITFQDAPDAALPPALQAGNPWGLRPRS
jgi:NADP-dependent aldehyde dehydrogenase